MTRAKDISKIVTDADLSGTLDVAGTVTAGGLTVEDTDATITITGTRGTGDTHTISAAGANNQNLNISADDSIFLRTSDTVQRIGIFSGGDISFYEDTGTTAKMVWDASTEQLELTGGTGTASLNVIGNTSQTGTDAMAGMRMVDDAGSIGFRVGITGATFNRLGVTGAGECVIYTPDNSNIIFGTNNAGRMRINSSGALLVGKTARGFNTTGVELRHGSDGVDSHFTVDGGTVCSFNRKTNDGSVVNFGQDGTVEGQINISGTTTSYLGGHLSRWSRLLDNSKDTSIVKGTVMTNLDEMVEWDDEDNEQLNKMAVSSVEGDANVAGVFVNWDDDDEWNDMNVAMTGDMVIRIAQGTTVARGDLLMSAGDGTAKPQGDDIVRSKTIAKVTSTNVSHTYDDGTYLVPCVLMAC